jgi:hypothetical protein
MRILCKQLLLLLTTECINKQVYKYFYIEKYLAAITSLVIDGLSLKLTVFLIDFFYTDGTIDPDQPHTDGK